jgi:phosphoserine phosphatase
LGKFEEVSAWTAKAMNGGVKFEDALAARLQILQPSRQDIDACLTNHPFKLTPGIQDLIRTLQERSIHVYLVSGGFRQMIEPVAARLDIPVDRIYANRILFDESNNYQYCGFDAAEPTSADQGKPKALRLIKQKGNYNTMVMVGDGATDAQAKPPADSFIGFGGVVEREAVRTRACWFVRDFQDMIAAVKEWKGKKC